MNSVTPTVRYPAPVLLAAVSLLFVLGDAAAVEPAAAKHRSAAGKAEAPTTATTESAAQRRTNAPSAAVSAADAPVQPPALDWSSTPRRSPQGRRR